MLKKAKFFLGFLVLFFGIFIIACNGVTTELKTTQAKTTQAKTTTELSTTKKPSTVVTTNTPTSTKQSTTVVTTAKLTTAAPNTSGSTTTKGITTSNGATTTKTTTTKATTTQRQAETYVFEAEYTDLDDLIGVGFSGGTFGTGLIVIDIDNFGASNGNYVSYLYSYGLTLTFVINSDRAVNDAILTLRLSAEVMDIMIAADTYEVAVNNNVIYYDDIEFNNVPTMPNILPFKDFEIGKISLIEGENIIELVTVNNDAMLGTMYSTAPLVDCIKIHTNAILTWDPRLDNLS